MTGGKPSPIEQLFSFLVPKSEVDVSIVIGTKLIVNSHIVSSHIAAEPDSTFIGGDATLPCPVATNGGFVSSASYTTAPKASVKALSPWANGEAAMTMPLIKAINPSP